MAGAVIATGGAAAPTIAAAVAGGVGLGAIAQGLTKATDKVQHESREETAARGELALSVRLRDPAKEAAAWQAMREAGGRAPEQDASGVARP